MWVNFFVAILVLLRFHALEGLKWIHIFVNSVNSDKWNFTQMYQGGIGRWGLWSWCDNRELFFKCKACNNTDGCVSCWLQNLKIFDTDNAISNKTPDESLEWKVWGKALLGGKFARNFPCWPFPYLHRAFPYLHRAPGKAGGNNRERHLRLSAASAVQKSGNNRKRMCL